MDKMVFHTARVTSLAWCPDGGRFCHGGARRCRHRVGPDKPAVARATEEGAPGGGHRRGLDGREDAVLGGIRCVRADVESVKKRRGVGDISRKRAARDDPRDTNGARRIRISDKTPPRRQLASVRAVVGFAARCATRASRPHLVGFVRGARRGRGTRGGSRPARRFITRGKRHVSRSPRGK